MDKLLKKPMAAVVGAIICTALWGTAYPVIKYSYDVLALHNVGDKLIFAGMRFLIAGAMVFAAACIRESSAARSGVAKNGVRLSCGERLAGVFVLPKSLWPWVALYGALQTGLMYILNYIGVANTTATKTSVLTAASAFFGVVAAPLFFKSERLTALKLAGVVIGFSGIVIVNFDGLSGSFSLMGEGLVLAATVMNTAGSFVGKRISGSRVFTVTAYQLGIGGVMILVAGMVMHGSITATLMSFGLTLWLAFVSAAAFTLWTALLVRHEAGRILVFNLFIPIFGAAWSFIILGETQITDPLYILSAVLIAAGTVMVNFTKFQRKV